MVTLFARLSGWDAHPFLSAALDPEPKLHYMPVACREGGLFPRAASRRRKRHCLSALLMVAYPSFQPRGGWISFSLKTARTLSRESEPTPRAVATRWVIFLSVHPWTDSTLLPDQTRSHHQPIVSAITDFAFCRIHFRYHQSRIPSAINRIKMLDAR